MMQGSFAKRSGGAGPAATIRATTRRLTGRALRAGMLDYDRDRDLPALIRADPFSPIADTTDGVKAIIARLERALRAERKRARSGHWTYDLNRHIALRQAYLAESARLASLQASR